MKKTLFFVCIFLLCFLPLNSFAEIATGDSFEFEIKDMSVYLTHNETVYIDWGQFKGKTVNITVDDFTDTNIINTTERADGHTYKTYSMKNQWQMMLDEFYDLFQPFTAMTFDFEHYQFTPPNNTEEIYQGLPVFASSGADYYIELMDRPESWGSGNTGISTKRQFFQAEGSISFAYPSPGEEANWDANYTASGELWHNLEIDINVGVINHLTIFMNYTIANNYGTTVYTYSLDIENKHSLRYEPISFDFAIGIVAIFAATSAITVVKKKKKIS